MADADPNEPLPPVRAGATTPFARATGHGGAMTAGRSTGRALSRVVTEGIRIAGERWWRA